MATIGSLGSLVALRGSPPAWTAHQSPIQHLRWLGLTWVPMSCSQCPGQVPGLQKASVCPAMTQEVTSCPQGCMCRCVYHSGPCDWSGGGHPDHRALLADISVRQLSPGVWSVWWETSCRQELPFHPSCPWCPPGTTEQCPLVKGTLGVLEGLGSPLLAVQHPGPSSWGPGL